MAEKNGALLKELLKGSGLIEPYVLEQVAIDSERLHISIDRALQLSGQIPDNELNMVLRMLAIVQSGKLNVNAASRALRLASRENIEVEEAISILQNLHKTTTTVNTVGSTLTQLLLSAGIINDAQFGRAIASSTQTGIMIGRMLLLNKDINLKTLSASISACLLLKHNEVEFKDAVEALKQASKRSTCFEQALFERGMFKQPRAYAVSLGDLLAMSGIISEMDLLECREIEISKGKDLSQILLEQGLVTKEQMEIIVQVQGLISNQDIKPFMAVSVLRRTLKQGVNIFQAVSDLKEIEKNIAAATSKEQTKIGELLVCSGCLSRVDLQAALAKQVADDGIKLGRILLQMNAVTEKALFNALRLQSLIKYKCLTVTLAVKVLGEGKQNDEALESTLGRMNLYMPPAMQWFWV
ncbi:hypothetical protein KA183_18220 [bacterium]|nr:hypothetical protein [bacterium]QQR59788.1 MAG: hypothetical protein IPG59_09980 [Candidatus Melainabacteria bacterium]